jgi:hypothetical protein
MQTFVQWKGTDLCMDFTCDCGGGGHFCGAFAYVIQCPSCKSYYEMPTDLPLKKLERTPIGIPVLRAEEEE